MAKFTCAVCEKKLGLLSGKTKISDGAICTKCLKSASISILNNPLSYTQQSIKELIEKRKTLLKNFRKTKGIGVYLCIDEINKAFKIGRKVFEYDNLLSYELLEDDQSLIKGGLGAAVAGGLLFGGVGAIVGGVVGKRKTKGVCNSMKLRVSLKNSFTDVVYINFIATETKTNSFMYKSAQDSAQKCITLLETILDHNRQNHIAPPVTKQMDSEVDEILKYKQLLDQGIITQEEFDAKKKNILGI